MLDLLVDHVGNRRRHLEALRVATLEVATRFPQPKDSVEICVNALDDVVLPRSARAAPNRRRVRAAVTGDIFVLGVVAERAFWARAVVNILRLTGIRQEEPLQLSKLSIRIYQQYLDRRRTRRPAEEYRPATASEWTEFEQNFDKRTVELGNCARPCGHTVRVRARRCSLPHTRRQPWSTDSTNWKKTCSLDAARRNATGGSAKLTVSIRPLTTCGAHGTA